jgi:methionyl-tRNA formyltransferase
MPMRLVMMGTGPFAVPTLRALAAGRHELVGVVSRPARVRAKEPPPPMHEAARELGLELWTPESINLPESVERLTALDADLLVVCDYGEILKPPVLASTRLGGINLHGSLLPKYRGAAPVQWAVLNGDQETGVTVIHMTPGLDAGPQLAQRAIAIDPDETAGELEARLAPLGAEEVVRVVEELATDSASPRAQDNSQATKAPRLTKEQGRLDWQQPAVTLKRRVRGLHPWPRAFSFWQVGERPPLRVNIDRVALADLPTEEAPPGVPLEQPGRLVVATGEGALEIVQIQPAGKRVMTGGEFVRGYAGGRFVEG